MAQTKKVSVNGVEYTLQHPGARWTMQMMDRVTTADGKILMEKMTDEILENVVVSPKVTIDDFDDDFGSLQELIQEAQTFLNSKKPATPAGKASGGQS
jgi:hypothetical protein